MTVPFGKEPGIQELPGAYALDVDGSPRFSIPGDGIAEVWQNAKTGKLFLVFFIPGTDPPVPIAWVIRDEETLQSMFGPGVTPVIDRTFEDRREMDAEGILTFGNTEQLANLTEHPWDAWREQYRLQSQIEPWLLDPQVMARVAAAFLEGRVITEAELKTTDWWRDHNAEQRAWLLLSASDPSTADRKLADNTTLIQDLFQSSGISGAPAEVTDFLARQMTVGNWTEIYTRRQIQVLADPTLGDSLGVVIDDDLARLVDGLGDLDTNTSRESTVRNLVNRQLGPLYGNWSDEQVEEWASRLRNEPDAQDELLELLQGQRLALFPGYTNPEVSYEDIAAPVRGLFQQQWGRTADETDEFFLTIANMDDVGRQTQLLRTEGLRRGVTQVADRARRDLSSVLGDPVRRAV